jgi:hypothetical protein
LDVVCDGREGGRSGAGDEAPRWGDGVPELDWDDVGLRLGVGDRGVARGGAQPMPSHPLEICSAVETKAQGNQRKQRHKN